VVSCGKLKVISKMNRYFELTLTKSFFFNYREPLISAEDLIEKPEINNKTSIKTTDKTKKVKAIESFKKGNDLIKDEYLDFRIRIISNLIIYIAKMKYFYFCAIVILSAGYHFIAIYANIWLSKWASSEKAEQHWYLSYYAAFGILQGKQMKIMLQINCSYLFCSQD
jgi:hypothetical protein